MARNDTCAHVPEDPTPPAAMTTNGCTTCLQEDRSDWVSLRECQSCGHIGCCNSSPGKHATAHYQQTGHPLIRSFEPGQNWWWCYVDEKMFELEGAPPAPSHL